MPVWSDDTIERYSRRAEQEFVALHPCIVVRVALDIVIGTSIYTLPDACQNIRRITWKGRKLDPVSPRAFREDNLSEETTGRPDTYAFSSIGVTQVRLHPTPNETITAEINENLLWTHDVIAEQCIVEYWSAPNHTDLVIPLFLRRRLIKMYMLKQLFALEGRGKSNKNVKYYSDLYAQLEEDYHQILVDLRTKPRRLINGDPVPLLNTGKPKPVLPPNYGVGVDY